MKNNRVIYFGMNLDYLLETRKIQQVELATLTGKTRASVNSWIHKNVIPSLETMIILSDFFSISMEEFIYVNLRNEKMLKNDIQFIIKKFLGSAVITKEFECKNDKESVQDMYNMLTLFYKNKTTENQ